MQNSGQMEVSRAFILVTIESLCEDAWLNTDNFSLGDDHEFAEIVGGDDNVAINR